MRRSISFMMFALAVGIVCGLSPVASAATSYRPSVPPPPHGSFGVRLVDVPVSEAENPRALRYIIDYLPTGSVIHRRIFIQNNEASTARFTVYADAAFISGGQFVGYAGATRNELTRWISVQHPTVTLAAGASVMDWITIRVPRGATRGEHYGVIWVQQSARVGERGREYNVIEVNRVGVRLYLAVGHGGAPPTSFDIASITGYRTVAGKPAIVAHVNNTGGRAIDLNGSVRLTDGPGNTAAGPFPAQRIVTLAPGQSWNIKFAVPSSLPDGSWQAVVTLTSGLTTAKATTTVQLGSVAAGQSLSWTQWIWLSLGTLILVLLIGMGWYALQTRRRQVPA